MEEDPPPHVRDSHLSTLLQLLDCGLPSQLEATWIYNHYTYSLGECTTTSASIAALAHDMKVEQNK